MVEGDPAEARTQGRIVVFGATGYTGALTARALVARGARPLLAGRSAERLRALAAELGGLEWRVADADSPERVAALLGGSQDVLVATVGPFVRWGSAAVEAAIGAGAAYLDSTGEPAFLREVFEVHGSPARASGALLLCAQGYDYVPGALAGALALEAAGPAAVRVDVGYYAPGGGPGSLSAGTRRSLLGAGRGGAFAYRDGTLRAVPAFERVRSFPVRGSAPSAVSIGGAEHFGLPAVFPRLREVNVFLGWFGPLARPLQVAGRVGAAGERVLEVAGRVPWARAVGERLAAGGSGGVATSEGGRLAERLVRMGGGGSTEPAPGATSWVAAEAYDAEGRSLAAVQVAGAEPYAFTAAFLAWSAMTLVLRPPEGRPGPGALGPVEAFGLEGLERGCEAAGIRRV